MSVKILTAVVLKLECALAQPEHLRAGPGPESDSGPGCGPASALPPASRRCRQPAHTVRTTGLTHVYRTETVFTREEVWYPRSPGMRASQENRLLKVIPTYTYALLA